MLSKLISLFKCAKRKVEDEFITPSGKNFALWIADPVNSEEYYRAVKNSKSLPINKEDCYVDGYHFHKEQFLKDLELVEGEFFVFRNLLIFDNYYRYVNFWSYKQYLSYYRRENWKPEAAHKEITGVFDVPVKRIILSLINDFDNWEFSEVDILEENEIRSWLCYYGLRNNREWLEPFCRDGKGYWLPPERKSERVKTLKNNGVTITWKNDFKGLQVSFGEDLITLTSDESRLIRSIYLTLSREVEEETAAKVRAERRELDRIAAEKAAAEKKIKDEQIKAERVAFDNKIANAL